MIYRVRVVASDPPPERFRWEIFKNGEPVVIERSQVSFRTEKTAFEAGKRALAHFLKDRGTASKLAPS